MKIDSTVIDTALSTGGEYIQYGLCSKRGLYSRAAFYLENQKEELDEMIDFLIKLRTGIV